MGFEWLILLLLLLLLLLGNGLCQKFQFFTVLLLEFWG